MLSNFTLLLWSYHDTPSRPVLPEPLPYGAGTFVYEGTIGPWNLAIFRVLLPAHRLMVPCFRQVSFGCSQRALGCPRQGLRLDPLRPSVVPRQQLTDAVGRTFCSPDGFFFDVKPIVFFFFSRSNSLDDCSELKPTTNSTNTTQVVKFDRAKAVLKQTWPWQFFVTFFFHPFNFGVQ